MALIVQKYGGTSVGTVQRIQSVAKRVLDTQAQGHQVIVVASAMAGETNRLVGLASEIHPNPFSREYDMLVASGEQISIGLLSLAINTEAEKRGLLKKGTAYFARPVLGYQLGIRTNSVFSKARIQAIDTSFLERELEQGSIPVIAGFQGVDLDQNITTLGRGGSDTSAVAIAAAIRADTCEIYTDVAGVYTTDPRDYAGARKIEKISYEEMMELASLGAKVLQIRSVELAAKYQVNLHVRSSFEETEGTKVVSLDQLGKEMEQVLVSGVAADRSQILLTLKNLPAEENLISQIFGALSDASVVVDVITQDVPSEGKMTLNFTVGGTDLASTRTVLQELLKDVPRELEIREDENIAKVSIVGVGMRNHPGVAGKMFRLLSDAGIGIKLVTTSEIKISCLIDAEKAKDAVACLHQGFDLDRLL
jgi:aspartate kinase